VTGFALTRVRPFAAEEASISCSRTSGSGGYVMLWFSRPTQHELLLDVFSSIWLCTQRAGAWSYWTPETCLLACMELTGLAAGPPRELPCLLGWVGCGSLGWDQPRAPHCSLFARRQLMPMGSRPGEKQQLPGKAPKGFTACLARCWSYRLHLLPVSASSLGQQQRGGLHREGGEQAALHFLVLLTLEFQVTCKQSPRPTHSLLVSAQKQHSSRP